MTRLVSTFPEALGALVIFREEYCRRFQIAQLSLFDLWRAKRRRLSADESGALSASGCSGPPSPRGIALHP